MGDRGRHMGASRGIRLGVHGECCQGGVHTARSLTMALATTCKIDHVGLSSRLVTRNKQTLLTNASSR